MFKLNSVQLAFNLALIAKDRNVTITPANGTLMSNMTATVVNRWQTAVNARGAAVPIPESGDSCVYDIVNAADGSRSTPSLMNTQAVYQPGEHDTLMDNYSADISKLVTQHIVYARSVVYKEMTDFVNRLSENVRNTSTPQAEDLFRVNFVSLHPVFEQQFIQDEVDVFSSSAAIADSPLINGGALQEANIDFSEKFSAISDSSDAVRSWMAVVGTARVNAFLGMDSNTASMSLPTHEQADYHLFHFLLNKLMVKDNSMAVACKTTMSLSQFVTSAAIRRDHHAQQLFHALKTMKTMQNLQYVIMPASYQSYSYLSSEPINLYVLETNFQKAVEKGVTLEHLFGHIAKNGVGTIDVDMLANNIDTLALAWSTQRSLYATFLAQNKASRLRAEMQQVLFEIIDTPAHLETMSAVYGKGSEYRDATVKKCVSLINSFSQTKLEDFQACAFDLIAVVVHRHSNAKEIISSMFDLMAADESLSTAQAVSVSIVLYLTDYLLSQMHIR